MDELIYDRDDIQSIAAGRLAKIKSISDDELSAYAQFEAGGLTRVTFHEPIEFEVDDVIMVGDNYLERVPASLWSESPAVGVVRKVINDQLIAEFNGGLHLIPRPNDVEIREGNTISYSETDKSSTVICEMPVRLRDPEIGDDAGVSSFELKEKESPPTFKDIGGYKSVVARAKELIETQLGKQEQLEAIGARPVKGIIFTGLPGTGKTLLARIIANELDARFFLVSGPSVVSKWVGDSEGLLRRLFEEAAKSKRSIIFFDEIDSIAGHRTDDSHDFSKRLVAQLLTLLDGVDQSHENILVLAATNRIEDIDDALLRPGRFDWEIQFGPPTLLDRFDILQVYMSKLPTIGDLPLAEIAKRTEGWTPAELALLWTEAALLAAGEERKAISERDLNEAFKRVNSRPRRTNGKVSNVN